MRHRLTLALALLVGLAVPQGAQAGPRSHEGGRMPPPTMSRPTPPGPAPSVRQTPGGASRLTRGVPSGSRPSGPGPQGPKLPPTRPPIQPASQSAIRAAIHNAAHANPAKNSAIPLFRYPRMPLRSSRTTRPFYNRSARHLFALRQSNSDDRSPIFVCGI